MRHPRLLLTVVLALAVLGTARARPTAPDRLAEPGRGARKPSEASDKKKPETKDDKKKTAAKDDKKKSAANAAAATFQGQIVRVEPGSVVVKHANGTGKGFKVTSATRVTGPGVQGLQSLTKGSMVTVHTQGKATTLIAVASLAPRAPNETATGGVFKGTVTGVHSDAYGDTGTVSVQPAKGAARTFKVTNTTHVDFENAGRDVVHTLQFVRKGQSVSVWSHGPEALEIQVMGAPPPPKTSTTKAKK